MFEKDTSHWDIVLLLSYCFCFYRIGRMSTKDVALAFEIEILP